MLSKFSYISNILNIICFKSESFLFYQGDVLPNILLMWCLGLKSFHFVLKGAPYLRRSFFNNLSPVIYKESFNNCLECNENIPNSDLIEVPSCSTMSDNTALLGNKASAERETKKQPNYFVAVQVTDQQVHSSIKLIQDHMLLQNDQLKKSMIARSTLHITLMVMHIKDTDDHSKAIKALNAVHKEYCSIINKEPMKLEFCGVSHFQNRVLYAKLKKNESYQLLCNLANRVCYHFEMVGLFSTDKRKEFTPHMTIAKLDFNKKSSKKIKKINPLWYEDFADLYLGCDTIRSIQLLKMQGPKTALGYYSGDELFFCSNDKIVWKKLNALLAIADKKKEIRSKISELTKKMLK